MSGADTRPEKRKDSLHAPGDRSDAWQKLKLEKQQEFVFGGYRPGSNGIDALLVGYYDDTSLRFAGKVRAGFVPHLRREVFRALKPHHVDDCPFVDLPNPKSSRWGGGVTADEMREMQWVKPELLAQIRFVECTAEGRLRHAAFPWPALRQKRARGPKRGVTCRYFSIFDFRFTSWPCARL
jgi:ATP-dependent DNA ligase